ncbi:MAG: FAD-dependent oxidoreductase [Firmicutes bacterium]|nr:FAD-dependent oxidoreductase [Bacillota bacterium]
MDHVQASPHFPKLFEPGQIGSMKLRNRIVMPPMGTNLASETGAVTDRMIAYYKERAKGGAGLIIVEIVCVDSPVGRAIPNQVRLDMNTYIAGHNELVEAVHFYGVKIIPQLHHAGRQTTPDSTDGMQPVAPSPIPCEFLQVQPRELATSEVEVLVAKFVDAAVRARNAGYDGVEIHGAHGYLITQFMSPRTNKRLDKYGGDTNGRMRFALEIIQGIRDKLGRDFPITFRMSADEFMEGGLTLQESKKIARILQDAGVDALHVSAGAYGSMPTILEPMQYNEGWRVYLAEEIKKVVDIPVITVGVIRHPDFAERVLAEGRADFVSVGRTLLADPEWPVKAMEGRQEDIRRCISCNIGCIGNRVFQSLHIRCTVNALTGREVEFGELKPANPIKRIMIVGGGPAGMEAARVAATRGHRVALYEKAGELGGQVRLASVPPGKDKIGWTIDYLDTQIRKLGVDIRLNTEVTPEIVARENPDVVIIATGATPIIPDEAGWPRANVATAWDVLRGVVEVNGQRVVVAGGGMTGCETALFLVERNKHVVIIEMLDRIASDMEPISRISLSKDLEEARVEILTGVRLSEVKDNGVVVMDHDWRTRFIPADKVVLALGSRPFNPLEAQIRALKELYVIGDAQHPGKLIDAIREGFEIGWRI